MRSKSSSISLRRASMSEHASLRDIKLRISMMWPDFRREMLDDPESVGVSAADIREGRVTVMESNGETAGFTTLSPYGDGDLQLNFFLDPGHWGDAVATRRMFQGAIDEARIQGVRRLWVLTTPAAVSFYQNHGFDKAGEIETQDGVRVRLAFNLLETIGNA